MNNYALMARHKLKSGKDLSDAYKHNERVFQVENADPLRQHLNIEVFNNEGKTYEELYEETLADLKIAGVPQRTIRKDAVKGFELVLGYSREREGSIDLDAWIQKNMEWVNQTYNPPFNEVHYKDSETGEDKILKVQNIKHAIVHRDESNTHMHVFIVPIDEFGRLNAKYYNEGRSALVAQHDSYSKAMQEFGLDRGEKHSVANHEQISAYYTNIKEAVSAELPEPMPEETTLEYKARADKVFQIEKSQHNNDVVKLNQELIHEKSVSTLLRSELNAKTKPIETELNRLRGALGEEELTDERIREVANIVQENQRFKKAVSEFPLSSVAEDTMKQYNEMVLWAMQQEREQMQHRDKNK